MKILFWRDHRILVFKPESNKKKTKKIQEFLKISYEKYGYLGFSGDIDDIYANSSYYFLAENSEGDVVAVLRATHKINDERLPIEKALRVETGGNYTFNENDKIMEINSFAYTNAYLTPILFRRLADHTIHHGINRIILLVDINSKRNQKLYEASGFKKSSFLTEQVYFDSFQYKKSQTPAIWDIMEIERNDVKKIWGERRLGSRIDMRIPATFQNELTKMTIDCKLVNLSKRGAKILADDEIVLNQKNGILSFSGKDKLISKSAIILSIRKLRKSNPDLEQERFNMSIHILFDTPLDDIYYF